MAKHLKYVKQQKKQEGDGVGVSKSVASLVLDFTFYEQAISVVAFFSTRTSCLKHEFNFEESTRDVADLTTKNLEVTMEVKKRHTIPEQKANLQSLSMVGISMVFRCL